MNEQSNYYKNRGINCNTNTNSNTNTNNYTKNNVFHTSFHEFNTENIQIQISL